MQNYNNPQFVKIDFHAPTEKKTLLLWFLQMQLKTCYIIPYPCKYVPHPWSDSNIYLRQLSAGHYRFPPVSRWDYGRLDDWHRTSASTVAFRVAQQEQNLWSDLMCSLMFTNEKIRLNCAKTVVLIRNWRCDYQNVESDALTIRICKNTVLYVVGVHHHRTKHKVGHKEQKQWIQW